MNSSKFYENPFKSTPTQSTMTSPSNSSNQFVMLNSEIDRLGKTNVHLSTQLHAKTQEAEVLRRELEASKQVSGPNINLQTVIANLTQEKHRLAFELAEKNKEIGALRSKSNSGFELTNSHHQHSSQDVSNLEARLKFVSQERDRFSILVNERSQEIQTYRAKIAELESRQVGGRAGPVVGTDREKEDLRRHVSELVSRLQAYEQEQSSVNSLKATLSRLVQENERACAILNEKAKENEYLRKLVADSSELQGKIALLTTENENLKRQGNARQFDPNMAVLQEKVNNLSHENFRLGTQLAEASRNLDVVRMSRSTIIDQPGKLSALTIENEKLNKLLTDNAKELAHLRQAHSALGDYQQKSAVLAEENEKLSNQLLEQSKEIEHLRTNNLRASSTINVELQRAVVGLTSDNERLSRQLLDQSKELEYLRQSSSSLNDVHGKVTAVSVENEKLTKLLIEKSKEVEYFRAASNSALELQGRISLLAGENVNLNVQIKDLRKELEHARSTSSTAAAGVQEKIMALASENDRLKAAIVEKTRELEYARTNSASLIDLKGTIVLLAAENERLNSKVIDQSREFEQSRSTHHNPELNDKLLKLSVENENLSHQLFEKTRQLEQTHHANNNSALNDKLLALSVENEKLNHQLQQAHLSSNNSVLNDKLLALSVENEKLSHQLIEKSRQLDDSRAPNNSVLDLQEKVAFLTAENERLNKHLLDSHTREHAGEEVVHHYHSSGPLEHQIAELSAENQNLHKKLAEEHHELEHLRQQISSVSELQAKIASLTAENEKLSKQTGEKSETDGTAPSPSAKETQLVAENQRLSRQLAEKNKIVEEWQSKYGILKQAYTNIKDATAQLDLIRQKYQDAVTISERVDPRLKLSLDSLTRKKDSTKPAFMDTHSNTVTEGQGH